MADRKERDRLVFIHGIIIGVVIGFALGWNISPVPKVGYVCTLNGYKEVYDVRTRRVMKQDTHVCYYPDNPDEKFLRPGIEVPRELGTGPEDPIDFDIK